MTFGTGWDPAAVSHVIDIELSPAEHSLKAVDRMEVFPVDGSLAFFLNKSLKIDGVRIDEEDVPFEEIVDYRIADIVEDAGEGGEEAYKNARLVRVQGSWGDDPVNLEVRYRGVIFDSLTVPEFSRTSIADETSGLIEERGAFLSEVSFWYPVFEGSMTRFHLTTVTPEGYETVSQGRQVSREDAGSSVITTWVSNCPSDAIYLIMGKWEVTVLHHAGIEIYAFFMPESKDLVESYLEATARYIDMYEEMIGPYAYGKFAIVENFFPTGYGMPSFTLLGSRVIRLPFIVYTSLGHEVLHNWWGNGVFVHYKRGNWCEGLTTYLADHHYKEEQSVEKGVEYRKNLLRDYTVYVNGENDQPVRSFTSRTTPATRALGYGKVAMIFHQLRSYMGEAKFVRALRTLYMRYLFKKAGWDDIQSIFSEIAMEDMDWYFDQWVDRKGAPIVRLDNVKKKKKDEEYEVFFRLKQVIDDDDFYRLHIPVILETETGNIEELVALSDFSEEFRIRADSPPSRLLIDQHCDVFRRLDPLEIEPTISTVLGDKNAILIVPSGGSDAGEDDYRDIAQVFKGKEEQVRIMPDEELTESDLRTRSLFVIGRPDENVIAKKLMRYLPRGFSFDKGGFLLNGKDIADPASVVIVIRNPFNSKKAVVFLCGSNLEEVAAPSRKIVHYGNYGYLSFNGGTIGEKGVRQGETNPLIYTF